MLLFILKFFASLLLLTGANNLCDAQPNRVTANSFSVDSTYRGYYVIPGVLAEDAPTWYVMSGKLNAIHWKVPSIYMDSLINHSFGGDPNAFIGVNPTTGLLSWNRKQDITLPYSQLTGTPSIPAAQVNSDWNAVSGLSLILNKPIIPAAQVNSDWNSSSGVSQILNKPTIPTNTNQLTNGSGYITASSANALSNKTGNISQWTNDVGYLTTTPSDSIKLYKLNGTVINQRIKFVVDTISVTGSASGFSVDISALGFTNVLSVNAIAVRNTASAASSPNVSVKSWSTSAVVFNIVEDNPATVTILGINVLSGSPSVFSVVTGLKLQLTIIGY